MKEFNYEEISIQLGKNIKKLRIEKGLKQIELAKKIGVSCNTISMIERGKINIGIERLLYFTCIFEVSLFDLLVDTSIVKTKVPRDFIQSYLQLNDNYKQLIDTMLITMVKQQRVSKDNKYFNNNENIKYIDMYDTSVCKNRVDNQVKYDDEFNGVNFKYDELEDDEFEKK